MELHPDALALAEKAMARSTGTALIILEGAPGAGKSLTLAALRRRLAPRPTLAGRGLAFDKDQPLSLLRRCANAAATATRHETGATQAQIEGSVHIERLGAALLAQDAVLTIDDIDLADDASRLALARLAASTSPALRMVVTALPMSTSSRTVAALHEVATEVIRLEPVDDDQAAAIVGERGSPHLPRTLVTALRTHTGGAAGHLDSCARMLAGWDDARITAGAVEHLLPAEVQRSVAATLARCEDATQAVAAGVAIFGDMASPARIAALMALTSADVRAGLVALDGLHLLADTPRPRWRSNMVRLAAVAMIPANDRARLYREAARMLHAEHEHSTRIAQFLCNAAPGAQPWVVALLQAAAAGAQRHGDLRTASRYLERALREPPGAEQRLAVLEELGRVDALLGRDPAAQYLAEALELTSDRQQQARVRLDLARALSTHGRHAEAAAQLNEALRVPELSPDLREDLEAAHRAITRSLVDVPRRPWSPETAQHPAARAQRAYELAVRGHTAGEVRQALGPTTGDALARLLAHPNGLAVTDAATVLVWLGDHQRAERLLAEAEDAIGDARITVFTGVTATLRAEMALSQGRIDDARRLAHEATTILDPRSPHHAMEARAWLAQIALELDDRALASQALDVAIDPEPSLPVARFRLAEGLVAGIAGDHERARQRLLEAGEVATRLGIDNPAVLPWRRALALASQHLGEGDLARTLASEERDRTEHVGLCGPRIDALVVLAGLMDQEEGIRLLTGAAPLRTWTTELASCRAQAHLGAAQRRAGGRRAATDHLHDARRQAMRMGALWLQRFAEAELLAAGAGDRRSGEVGAAAALTPSECRVAELVAAGMTNREVAARLYVTVKAVEFHLSNVYTKLGVRSRRELPQLIGS